jgi:hippurate hydrolase
VADRLRSFGCDEVATGIGRTGVVGVIRGRRGGSRTVALRADMDALPIEEESDLPHKSTVPGVMHACGHDGHTAMLLGAARYLADTRNFAGAAVLVFQPAEEGGAGARAMLDDGLIERFAVEEFYGMHSYPGLPVGHFATRPGPLMAAANHITIDIAGVGGHAAAPHRAVDTILVGAQIVTQLQSIVARNVDPLEAAVVSICQFQGGHADNVIPHQARLVGTARSLSAEVRELLELRVREVVEGTARLYGAWADLSYKTGYPVLINDESRTAFASAVAREIAGDGRVNDACAPMMAAEDFAYMLEERPGAFIFIGNGNSAGLHHPAYDFNDEAIAYGTSYWVRLVETALAG